MMLRRTILLLLALCAVCTIAVQAAPQSNASSGSQSDARQGSRPGADLQSASGAGLQSGSDAGSGSGAGSRPHRPARRQPVGIVYWDLDHFHDTVPALFYDDDDYTPGGRLHWDSERYGRKLRNTAAVIDSMALPLVALWSIENEAVVRDLAAACAGEYSYLHRTLNSLDGMDFALLYYGDAFFPEYVEEGRRYLYIEGALRHPGAEGTERLGLVLCSDVRTALWLAGDIREEHPGVPLLVLGRTALPEPEAYGLRDVTARAAAAGHGNVRRGGGWSMRDRILADTALSTRGGDAFIRRYLLDDRGEPLPTYDRHRYRGGYGYALPVFVYLE